MFFKILKNIILFNVIFFSTSTLVYSDINYEKTIISKWVKNNSCKLKNKVNTSTLINIVYYNSNKYNIDPHLMIGLIRQESCFDYKAKSNAGAIGLTQVIPKWHKNKIKGRSLIDPYVSVEVGTRIVAEYLKLSNGNLQKALKRYSGGANKYYSKIMTNVYSIKKQVDYYKLENKQSQYFLANLKTNKLNNNDLIVNSSLVYNKEDELDLFIQQL